MKKLIILAAGHGTRLRPLTNDRPKCMVPLHGRPLIAWQAQVARELGFTEVVVVRGYRGDALRCEGATFVDNPAHERTNMVYSLWCAREHIGDGCVVSYGDIVFTRDVLRAVVDAASPVTVAVDLAWEPYWRRRFGDPLRDAETMRFTEDLRITEVGQRPSSIEEVMGQYIGLSAWTGGGGALLRETLDALAAGTTFHPDRGFEKLYVTDLLQGLIARGHDVRAAPIRGGWLEVDSVEDLRIAEDLSRSQDGRFDVAR